MDKRILITGGSGFIGQSLIQNLIAKGFEVHSIVHSVRLEEQNGLIQHHVDLFNRKICDSFLKEYKFKNLIHLAWYVGKGCHSTNANLDWSVATLNLVKSFVENGGEKFAGAGSVSEYDYKYGYFIEDETPCGEKTMYGTCKNSMYKILKVYCGQNGCQFKWLRIFNLYGKNEKPQRLMPSVIISCLKGEDIKVSNCSKFQDYLYLEDTVDGIIKVFESDIQGAVNICSGKAVQLCEIVTKIAQLTNFKGKILWGAVPAAFEENLTVGSNEKLKSLNWEQKYTLDEGLKLTVDWWKDKLKESVNV